MTGVKTGLEAIEEQNRLIRENTLATTVSNVLLLGQAMGVKDVTAPSDLQRVLRHLKTVERAVRTDSDE